MISETGTAPIYAGLFSLFLAIILSLLCKKSIHWTIIFASVFILQVSTQVIKSGLKQTFAEPRPYMSYIAEKGVDIPSFYKEKRSIRTTIIASTLKSDPNTPNWLQQHWMKETGYSFPSGHTTFAVTWLCLFIGFVTILNSKKTNNTIAIMLVYIWAGLMIISRLVLGMHFPIDVFVATIFPPIISYIYFLWLKQKGLKTLERVIQQFPFLRPHQAH